MVAVIVFVLAGLVHLVTVSFVAGAAILLAFAHGAPLWVRLAGAALLLGVAYFVQPFRRRSRRPIELDRQQAPHLFALIDEIATSIQAPSVERVAIVAEFNAFYTAEAFRGRIIGIGMSLWSVVDGQARVALLGHELAHAVNGDLRNTKLVGRAVTTLARWQQLLRPPATRRWQQRVGSTQQGLVNLAERIVMPILLIPVVAVIGGFGRTLQTLANRQGQRSEYYADDLAARAAGSDGAIELTERLLIGDLCVNTLTRTIRFDRQSDPWLRLHTAMKELPPTEWERRRRLARRTLNRIDVTHPPTQLRSDLIRHRSHRTALVVLDANRSAQIDAELKPYKDRVASGLSDRLGVADR